MSRRLQLRENCCHSASVGARSVRAVEVGVGGAHGLAVLLDEPVGVELGVDHDRVGRGVAEQRLDDVHRRVVVEVLGGEQPPAVVRAQRQRRAVGPRRAGTI
jgi:hypothetical protein